MWGWGRIQARGQRLSQTCVSDGQVKGPLPLWTQRVPRRKPSSRVHRAAGWEGPGHSPQSDCSSAAKRDSLPSPTPIHPIPTSVPLSDTQGHCCHPTEAPRDQAKQETLTAQVRQPVLHPGQTHTNPGSLRAVAALFLSAHHTSGNSLAENSPDQGAGDSIQLPPPAPDTGSLDHSLPRSGTWLTHYTEGFFRISHSLPHHPLGPCGRQTSVPHMRDAGSRIMRTA